MGEPTLDNIDPFLHGIELAEEGLSQQVLKDVTTTTGVTPMLNSSLSPTNEALTAALTTLTVSPILMHQFPNDNVAYQPQMPLHLFEQPAHQLPQQYHYLQQVTQQVESGILDTLSFAPALEPSPANMDGGLQSHQQSYQTQPPVERLQQLAQKHQQAAEQETGTAPADGSINMSYIVPKGQSGHGMFGLTLDQVKSGVRNSKQPKPKVHTTFNSTHLLHQCILLITFIY
jgi:hypothetical protein